MPLYIVRWPRAEVCLINAQNEAHLIDQLDEIADPGCARWAVYNGPLWIDLGVPHVTAEDGERHVDIDAFLGDEDAIPYDVQLGGQDTRTEMLEAVSSWALPRLHAAVEARAEELAKADDGEEDAVTHDSVWRKRFTDAIAAELSDMELHAYQRRVDLERKASPEQRSEMETLGISIETPALKDARALAKRIAAKKKGKPRLVPP